MIEPTFAQSLDEQQRLNEMDKAVGLIEGLKSQADQFTRDKKAQCVASIGDQSFCECISQSLPVIIDFRQYVALVTHTKDELEYDKQSAEDKKVIDNSRAARDQCVKAAMR